MGKRGRPRKGKSVTYDSRETKVFLGLIFLGIAVFSLLSYIITEDASVFGFLRKLFGNSTLFFSIFTFNLSLWLFGLRYFMSSKKSLISQLIITFSLAIIFSADAPAQLRAVQSYMGNYGGILGYEIANLSLNNFLLNLTVPVFWVVVLVFLPAAFNQNIAEFFTNIINYIKMAFNWLSERMGNKSNQEELIPTQEEVIQPTGPAMFGDFRRTDALNRAKQIMANGGEEENPINKGGEFVGLENAGEHHEAQSQHSVKAGNQETTLREALKYPNWKLPPVTLLDSPKNLDIPEEDIKNNGMIIEQTLSSFGIEARVMDASVGPSVTQYALDIALGIKVSKVANLRNDLALALATSANAVRIEAPIPGTSYVGIEVPNKHRRPVFFRELIDGSEMKGKIKSKDDQLPVTVGKNIAGEDIIADIQDMPHLLIAGATGSGKSVLTNSFIASLLMSRSPDEVRFIMVDPKQVELSDYNGIPHLLTPVIVDMAKVANALKWAVNEMEERYTLFREERVRNIEGYNEKHGFAALPYIVVVIDEMADMMLTTHRVDIETSIVKLAQKARATGIHLILATQRPSVNVITGLIKANIPGRIGLSVTTNTDSRVILDQIGAENLLGKGDMLFKKPDKPKAFRVQGVFINQDEIQRIVNYIKDQTDEVEYMDDVVAGPPIEPTAAEAASGGASDDSLFIQAAQIIVSTQKGSASLLQRKLSIGYNRAAKLIDEMCDAGIVGQANGSKPREVLVHDLDAYLNQQP
jgi:DNA segregation ATPase FtsK/SpoIIIE-like protein